MNDQQLTNKIMRRVYFVYFMKRALHPLMMKVYVLFAAFIGVLAFTSVPHVFANMPFEPLNLYTFGAHAFMHTDLVVQVSVLLGGVTMLLLASDVLKSFSHSRQTSFQNSF